jgi:hypothetical protein
VGEVLKLQVHLSDLTEQAKRAGRQKLAVWLRSVDARIDSRELIDFDGRLARALTKFPSSVLEGHCWSGQLRLSRSLSKSDRTVRRSIGRLERCGLLLALQRGRGRTARYVFCIDRLPVFPGLSKLAAACEVQSVSRDKRDSATRPDDRTSMSELARTKMSGLTGQARTKMSDESSKKLKIDSSKRHHESTADGDSKTAGRGETKRLADKERQAKPKIQVIQNAIVAMLGSGDVQRGSLCFMSLTDFDREFLTECHLSNELTDELIEDYRAKGSPSGSA